MLADFAPFFFIFVPFGIWWWVLVLAELFLVGVCSQSDDWWGGWGVIFLIGGLALWTLCGDLGLFSWVVAHPWSLAAGCGIYLVAGVVWSIYKWRFIFLSERMRAYESFKDNWLREHSQPRNIVGGHLVIPDDSKSRFLSDLKSAGSGHSLRRGSYSDWSVRGQICVRPLARDNKARITRWMAYWPWSLTWYLVADFLTHLFRAIAEWMEGVFDSMAHRHFRNVEGDWKLPPPPAEVHGPDEDLRVK